MTFVGMQVRFDLKQQIQGLPVPNGIGLTRRVMCLDDALGRDLSGPNAMQHKIQDLRFRVAILTTTRRSSPACLRSA